MEKKIYALKAANVDENGMDGAASIMGSMDQGQDVVFPGFYKSALAVFLKEGFIPVGHNWDQLPVGYPTMAEERGVELYAQGKFHTTQAGQDARTVAMERKQAGLTMGLSVGFTIKPGGYKWFNTGAELIKYAKESGQDMSMFDVKGIEAWKGLCRALLPGGCEKLFEFSIVAAPMHTGAGLANVKSLFKGLVERKGELLGDVERSATCSAISRVLSALSGVIWNALYNVTAEDAPALAAQFAPAFDEARDLCVQIASALLADCDFEELQEDAYPYYYYYSLPEDERETKTFLEKAGALVTASSHFVTLAARRQEARRKSGRKLSQESLEKLKAIREHLAEGGTALDEMITSAAPGDEEAEADAKARAQMLVVMELLALESDMNATL